MRNFVFNQPVAITTSCYKQSPSQMIIDTSEQAYVDTPESHLIKYQFYTYKFENLLSDVKKHNFKPTTRNLLLQCVEEGHHENRNASNRVCMSGIFKLFGFWGRIQFWLKGFSHMCRPVKNRSFAQTLTQKIQTFHEKYATRQLSSVLKKNPNTQFKCRSKSHFLVTRITSASSRSQTPNKNVRNFKLTLKQSETLIYIINSWLMHKDLGNKHKIGDYENNYKVVYCIT
ncbi:hypothetical protein AGLY_001732 [Aphis glycines]|uniref:Uncharacterized protein n=1 Tax=Aphis glycines TaxID=307491 RepID=A0A6G0U523_APHGL|nr:hypothetical protein AGLY_001732 [Aphis glycines]